MAALQQTRLTISELRNLQRATDEVPWQFFGAAPQDGTVGGVLLLVRADLAAAAGANMCKSWYSWCRIAIEGGHLVSIYVSPSAPNNERERCYDSLARDWAALCDGRS